jgi:hypothetical protein
MLWFTACFGNSFGNIQIQKIDLAVSCWDKLQKNIIFAKLIFTTIGVYNLAITQIGVMI